MSAEEPGSGADPGVARRVVRNYGWLLALTVLGRSLTFTAAVVLARTLTESGFGHVAIALTLTWYGCLAVDAGLSAFGAREVAQDPGRSALLVGRITAIRLLLALGMFALVFVTVLALPLDFEVRVLFWAMSLWLFAWGLNLNWLYQGRERMRWVGGQTIVAETLFLVLIIAFVRSDLDIERVGFIRSGSWIVAVVVLWAALPSIFSIRRINLSLAGWRDYLAAGLPMGISTMLTQFYLSFGIVALGWLASSEEAGVFNAAFRISMLVFGVTFVYQSAVFPIMSSYAGASDLQRMRRLLDLSVRGSLIVGTYLLMLAATLGEELLAKVYGDAFREGSVALTLLIAAVIAAGIGGIFGWSLMASRLGERYFIATLVGAILGIGTSLALVPAFGLAGAGAATLVAGVAVAVLGHQFTRDLTDTVLWAHLPGLVLSGGAAGGVVYAVHHLLGIPAILAVVASAPIYVVSLLLLRILRLSEVTSILRMVTSLRSLGEHEAP